MLVSHARTIANTAAVDGTYESTLKALKDANGGPRVIFPLHLGNVTTSIIKFTPGVNITKLTPVTACWPCILQMAGMQIVHS